MMLITKKIYRMDFLVLFLLGLLVFVSFLIPLSFAEKIVYSTPTPAWYSYPCVDTAPANLTHVSERPTNIWKYFSYYDDTCYVTLHTFDFSDLADLENVTSINYYVDTKSIVVNDLNEIDPNTIACQLYYLGYVDSSDDISTTPTAIASSFDCAEPEGNVISSIIPFNAANNNTVTTAIQAGNFSQSFILFPVRNATLLSNLTASDHDLAIGKFKNALAITGDGFNCVTIELSNWCNFQEEPWVAVKKALGADYVGDWFYVFAFLPLPFTVFLISRNGAYAGFVCLPIILFINTIDHVIYQISLSLITLAAAFGFYELIRKKLVE